MFDRAERYVYDSDPSKGGLDDVVLAFDDAGSLKTRTLHGPEVDQIMASEDFWNDVFWALNNNQGTVKDIVKYDPFTLEAEVVNHIVYDSFGGIKSETDPSTGQAPTEASLEDGDFLYSYTGRVWDADAEMYYYRKRWYDAPIGRFVSEDPKGFAAGDPNINRYVGNSPTNATDPSGLDFIYNDDGNVYWQVQEDGYLWNSNVGEPIYIGRQNGDQIDLSDNFGGGTVDYSAVEQLADNWWNNFSDHIGDTQHEIASHLRGLFREISRNNASYEAANDKMPAAVIKGYAHGGFVVGYKGVVNGASKAIVSSATLGQRDGGELIPVTEFDRSVGYGVSEGSCRIAGEFIIGAGTGYAGTITKGGKVVQIAGKGALIYDGAGNVIGVGQNGYDIYENGLDWRNGVGLVGSGAGLAGNAKGVLDGIRAGKKVLDRTQIDNILDGLPSGRTSRVKTVADQAELDKLFGELSRGGQRVQSGYRGDLFQLPDGTLIGRRASSRSGGPTLDIHFSDGIKRKIHIEACP